MLIRSRLFLKGAQLLKIIVKLAKSKVLSSSSDINSDIGFAFSMTDMSYKIRYMEFDINMTVYTTS